MCLCLILVQNALFIHMQKIFQVLPDWLLHSAVRQGKPVRRIVVGSSARADKPVLTSDGQLRGARSVVHVVVTSYDVQGTSRM